MRHTDYSKYDLEPSGSSGLKSMTSEAGMAADLMRAQWKKGTKNLSVCPADPP
jgi:hypothetical protein